MPRVEHLHGNLCMTSSNVGVICVCVCACLWGWEGYLSFTRGKSSAWGASWYNKKARDDARVSNAQQTIMPLLCTNISPSCGETILLLYFGAGGCSNAHSVVTYTSGITIDYSSVYVYTQINFTILGRRTAQYCTHKLVYTTRHMHHAALCVILLFIFLGNKCERNVNKYMSRMWHKWLLLMLSARVSKG